jgi:hypothetical protein
MGYEISSTSAQVGAVVGDSTRIGVGAAPSWVASSANGPMTAIGSRAAYAATSADHIVAIGNFALAAITDNTGSFNTAVGIDSMRAMTSGQQNVALGEHTITTSTTANGCTAVGYQALYNGGGTGNVAVGFGALASSSGNKLTGNYNAAVGYNTLTNIQTTAQFNSGFGTGAGQAVTTGSFNTIFGASSGNALTTGTNNLIAGYSVGQLLATGSGNILFGTNANVNTATTITAAAIAIGCNSTGTMKVGSNDIGIGNGALAATSQDNNANIAIGTDTLKAATTGGKNIGLGYQAGTKIAGGGFNICIGYQAGNATLVGGSSNILIGTSTDTPASGTSNYLNIGALLYGDLSNKYFGIGTSTVPVSWLGIAAGTTAKSQINFASSTAPTSPVDGDFWYDGTNLKFRQGGSTKTVTII